MATDRHPDHASLDCVAWLPVPAHQPGLHRDIDPARIEAAARAIGTATIRRLRWPAEEVGWRVIGMARCPPDHHSGPKLAETLYAIGLLAARALTRVVKAAKKLRHSGD